MPAFILDHLDADGKLFGGMAMTMETSGRMLGLPRGPQYSLRFDLVLYNGGGRPLNEQKALALVECKRGFVGDQDDRDRLKDILPAINCRYGILCGWVRSKVSRDAAQAACKKIGERWFDHPFLIEGAQYFFGAALITVE